MTPDEIDRELRRLGAAAQRISDNLLEFELDEIRMALDTTQLAGDSALRWREADETLQLMWQWYSALEQVLARAAEVRGTRTRLSDDQRLQLDALLAGRSIVLPTHNVPIHQRDLLGESVATVRCTPEELLAKLSAAFDEVKTVVAAAQTAWETLRPRLIETGAALERSADVVRALGGREPVELARLRATLTALGDRLAADPLAARGEALDDAEAAVADFANTVERLRELPEQLQQARELVARARAAALDARAVHAEVTLKIAAAEVPEPLVGIDGLDDELEHVAALTRESAWEEARHALERCTERATLRLEQAHDIAAANRAPIERRNELRGLLDAYRGKARRIGSLEDPGIADLYAAAQSVLYTAPTDLEHAGTLVRRYGEALGHGGLR